jgi:hypothetical protein
MMAMKQRRGYWSSAWKVLTAEMRRYEYAAGTPRLPGERTEPDRKGRL